MAKVDFNVTQGATLDVRVTINDDGGDPKNFSGTSLRGFAKAHYYTSGKMVNLNPTIVSGNKGRAWASGLVDIKLSGSVTSGLPVTQGVYDIEQVTTGSAGQETDVTRILEGKFNVFPEATF